MPRSSASYPSAAAAAEGGAGAEAAEAEADLSRALSPEGEAAGAGEAAEEAAEEAGALEGDGEGYTTLRQPGWEVMGGILGQDAHQYGFSGCSGSFYIRRNALKMQMRNMWFMLACMLARYSAVSLPMHASML